ncbi:MAG: hypothetical protein UV20_C0035G0002 [Candidatus Magasanikbacteria bacterium GW2011_GWA2_42_32]|uniref:Uncharacterized protein n=1 Tax=Candidatus Magasanikbacteria bacterium GW2011_GWA2_42_32 TaxID=1619039 RepID=A0A0G1A094_9BACT|nr:MAG: hypothetical protein UV20_C0035G0002 [Candidatus Magasanikbacteria bacterium GW2011_GWA2_42_32]
MGDETGSDVGGGLRERKKEEKSGKDGERQDENEFEFDHFNNYTSNKINFHNLLIITSQCNFALRCFISSIIFPYYRAF